jgi:hypothetical protein
MASNLNHRILWAGTLCLATFAGLTVAQESESEWKIGLTGYIEDPFFQEMISEMGRDFLGHSNKADTNRNFARAIVTYIGPNLVSDGRFVPPEGFHISEQQMEIMSGKIFPEEGCRIERLVFAHENAFIILLVDATDDPSREYIETCFLGAILAALGEDIDGTPIPSRFEADALIRSIVD